MRFLEHFFGFDIYLTGENQGLWVEIQSEAQIACEKLDKWHILCNFPLCSTTYMYQFTSKDHQLSLLRVMGNTFHITHSHSVRLRDLVKWWASP